VTPKQVIATVTNTCETLLNLGLMSNFNLAREDDRGGRSRVSWATRTRGTSYVHPFGSLEQYLQWVRDGEYTGLLFDFSLIRASYTVIGNRILGHSLLFWPFPLDPAEPLTDVPEVCAALELCIESPSKAAEVFRLSLRSPMRFDYAPDHAADDHPEIHLHTQFEDTRIHVQKPLSFNTFVKIIFRTFYADRWLACQELGDLHEQNIVAIRGDIAPSRHCMQLAWV